MEVGCEAGEMAEVEHVECAALRGEGQRERGRERVRGRDGVSCDAEGETEKHRTDLKIYFDVKPDSVHV